MEGDLVYSVETYLTPRAFHRRTPDGRDVAMTLKVTSPITFDDMEVTRVTARSHDGSEIPINIIRRKGMTPDGSHPTLLSAYGGYGISQTPAFLGAALTQHPELFRAVVSIVGVYDMLRDELDPNGEFNTTEFGTVANLEQFRALYAYSPYHRVRDGVAYPAALMQTGENDGRVNPMHSRKFAARLQAATISKHPILLATTSDVGHGIGSPLSVRVGQTADYLAFLFDQLGMTPGSAATKAR